MSSSVDLWSDFFLQHTPAASASTSVTLLISTIPCYFLNVHPDDERISRMTRSDSKTAIITGASRGIGRAVASRLTRDGFAVVVNYAGNTAKAEEVVNEIKSAGGQAIAVQADVANAADVERHFKEALATFDRIDVVVNSAGIMPLGRIADNAVAPGPVATELFLNHKTQAQIDQLSQLPPLERLGQPEDIANVVSFLAGPEGGWVNGQVLRANGGFA
jgi:NAD(P)-dependent dehydrogenase (short-subunit alcohol dehydrogenase family)